MNYKCELANGCNQKNILEGVLKEHGEPAARELMDKYCNGNPELCPVLQNTVYRASAKLMTTGNF